MSYSLYRKYRPAHFGQVFGQDHIVKALVNQVSTGAISHAYLFCGTRGTGKTSIARLVARALNCQDTAPQDMLNAPCNTCEVCTDILQNRSMNVIEIDAASNNGVDNIRDILEEVKYPPVSGKYKIYIIDEVHMLSIGAFNALLKTLEEPPSHVIFILATTDQHKVPATIHSRCQRFEFRRVSASELASNITPYLTNEGVSIDPAAINLIARLGDGSVRDTLSLCDQAISFYKGEHITEVMVRNLVGAVDTSVLFETIDALLAKDAHTLIQIIHDQNHAGRDFGQFITELILHCRNLMVAKVVTNQSSVLDFTQDMVDRLVEQAKHADTAKLTRFIGEFTDLSAKIKHEKNQKILLEIACIKLCSDEVVQVAPVATAQKPAPTQRPMQKPAQAMEEPAPQPQATEVAPVPRVPASAPSPTQNLASAIEVAGLPSDMLKNLSDDSPLKNALSKLDINAVTSNKKHQSNTGITQEQEDDMKQKLNIDVNIT